MRRTHNHARRLVLTTHAPSGPPARPPQMDRVREEQGEEGVKDSAAGFYVSESATKTHWCLVSPIPSRP